MGNKVKIFVTYTDDYVDMFELFKKSLDAVSNHFEVIPVYQKQYPITDFMDEHFRHCIYEKYLKLCETVQENEGEIILWSDCDILFLVDPYEDVIKALEQADLVGLTDGGDIEGTTHHDYMNIGFLAIRCSMEMFAFFKKATRDLFFSIKRRELFGPGIAANQRCINRSLKQSQIRFSLLPPKEYYCVHLEFPESEIDVSEWGSWEIKKMIHFTVGWLGRRVEEKMFLMRPFYRRMFCGKD